MWQFISQSLTLILPIFIGGVSFIFILKHKLLMFLDKPIDHGITFRKHRLFGDNKTWRGVIVYSIGAVLVSWLLYSIASIAPGYVHAIYTNYPMYIGMIFSLSYCSGELVNSFIKRQSGIAPGTSSESVAQTLIDNIDGMLLTAVVLLVALNVAFTNVFVAIIIGVILHEATDAFMKKLRLK